MRSSLLRLLSGGLLALGAAGLLPLTAQGQNGAGWQTQVTATKEQILRSYILQDFPNPHPPFAFNILIPKEWVWFEKEGRPTAPNGKPQLLIAYGDKGDTSLVEVLGFHIQREIAPADWLREWLKINNYEILASRLIPAAPGTNADVKARKIVNGRPVLFRIRTFKNGDYIYILHCFSGEETYPQVEQHFLVAAQTFELTKAPAQQYAEPMRDVSLEDVFDIGVKIPASWTVKPDLDVDPDCRSWVITNGTGEKSVGIINIYAAPRARFRDATAAAAISTRWLQGNGADYAGAALATVDSGIPDTSVAVTEQKAALDGAPGLVRQTVIGTEKGWVVFSLATKALTPDPYLITLINRRAYDIAYDSFLKSLMKE